MAGAKEDKEKLKPIPNPEYSPITPYQAHANTSSHVRQTIDNVLVNQPYFCREDVQDVLEIFIATRQTIV